MGAEWGKEAVLFSVQMSNPSVQREAEGCLKHPADRGGASPRG